MRRKRRFRKVKVFMTGRKARKEGRFRGLGDERDREGKDFCDGLLLGRGWERGVGGRGSRRGRGGEGGEGGGGERGKGAGREEFSGGRNGFLIEGSTSGGKGRREGN